MIRFSLLTLNLGVKSWKIVGVEIGLLYIGLFLIRRVDELP